MQGGTDKRIEREERERMQGERERERDRQLQRDIAVSPRQLGIMYEKFSFILFCSPYNFIFQHFLVYTCIHNLLIY